LGVLQDRFRRRRRLLAMIPRRCMPVIHMGDLSKRHLSLVLRQIVLSAHTKADAPLAANSAFQVAHDPAHFADSVRASADVLSSAATRIAASLQRRAQQTLPDYVRLLRRHVPALAGAVCDAYVAAVEDAADADADPLTREEYADFVTNFYDMLRALDQYSADGATTATTTTATRRKPSNAAVASPPPPPTTSTKPKRRKDASKKKKEPADADADDVPLRKLKKSALGAV
jgi:hypothetical protein